MHDSTPARHRGRREPPDQERHPVDIHVGRRIRLRRTLLAMSEEELALRLGMHFQQVQRYEKGAARLTAGRLYEISLVLEVPIGWFFENMDPSMAAVFEHLRGGAPPLLR